MAVLLLLLVKALLTAIKKPRFLELSLVLR
jgi:hypothetical protein